MNASIENIQSFYFGSPEKQLYGNYHAVLGNHRKHGIVLCYPMGDEYIRVHRAYRQLATRLNRIGFPVLRFDYFGMGDSAGEDIETSLTQWLTDTGLAIDELKRRAGVAQVCLVGLRLGALLAFSSALKRQDVDGLVLWEPAVNGADYLAQVQESHNRKLLFLHRAEEPAQSGERPAELLGFQVSDAFYNELNAIDLLTVTQSYGGKVFVTEGQEQPLVTQFREHLEGLGIPVKYQPVEGPVIWAEDPDKALVPNEVLQAMVTWLVEGFA